VNVRNPEAPATPPVTEATLRGFNRVYDAASLDGLGDLHARIVAAIVAAVAEVKGEAAAARVSAEGLGQLHQVVEASEIGRIRDLVLEPLRHDLLRMAVKVGREVLGWRDDFHVDDYLILRINLPYAVARRSAGPAENPGIGRVSPAVRELAASRRVKDPIYDPAGYHRGHPPAAWAHGPHLDSWSGHSRDGVNIWWAMCDVPAEAGMVLYPELDPKRIDLDRRTLYVAAGQPLPAPTFSPLAAGEMLIFDPEILHGTHLNITARTRVAVSLRLNAGRPTFDPATFYAREFWRQARDIESGAFEAIAHVRREDNLGPPRPSAAGRRIEPARVRLSSDAPGLCEIGPASLLAEGGRLVVSWADRAVLLTRRGGRLSAVDAECPHYGVALADGGDRDGRLFCPACAVGFDLSTGRSACAELRLRTYTAFEKGGALWLDLPDAARQGREGGRSPT
jgi:nitrite reductase/ring-hydroxylating ferredoxin subunit